MWTDQGWVPHAEPSADQLEATGDAAEGPAVQVRLQEEIDLCRHRLEALEARLQDSRSSHQPTKKRTQVTELRERPIAPHVPFDLESTSTLTDQNREPHYHQTPNQVFVEPPPRRGLLSPVVVAPAPTQEEKNNPCPPPELSPAQRTPHVSHQTEKIAMSMPNSGYEGTGGPTTSSVMKASAPSSLATVEKRRTESPRPVATSSNAVDLVLAPRRATPEPQNASVPTTPALELLRTQRETLKQELHRVRRERQQLQAMQVKFTASASELRHLWKVREEAEESSHEVLLSTLNRLTPRD
jgi:hypothetical protein